MMKFTSQMVLKLKGDELILLVRVAKVKWSAASRVRVLCASRESEKISNNARKNGEIPNHVGHRDHGIARGETKRSHITRGRTEMSWVTRSSMSYARRRSRVGMEVTNLARGRGQRDHRAEGGRHRESRVNGRKDCEPRAKGRSMYHVTLLGIKCYEA